MLLSSILFFSACSTVEKNYVFGVDDVIITQEGRLKNNVKSKTEFVSIAYNDIFGKPLTGSQLEILTLAYESYGDNKFTEDLIVRNFLNSPDVEITPLAEMRADVPKFVKACYRKFFSRDPNEFELWYMVREIESDPAYTPELVYYALMTSNEYRFY
ncbi:MAG: hypothetical protein EAZ57_02710 [Cytophagales bacterium]|nr:MAG: hypothetical protein EAZ57_02710 [Cytophagales bacterium]